MVRIADADGPRGLAERLPQQILIPAGVDESAQAAGAKRPRGKLDGESFPDSPQIEFHAGPDEPNRAGVLVEHDIVEVHQRPDGVELLRRGDVRLVIVKAPEPDKWADRDVEGAAALPADELGRLDDAETAAR